MKECDIFANNSVKLFFELKQMYTKHFKYTKQINLRILIPTQIIKTFFFIFKDSIIFFLEMFWWFPSNVVDQVHHCIFLAFINIFNVLESITMYFILQFVSKHWFYSFPMPADWNINIPIWFSFPVYLSTFIHCNSCYYLRKKIRKNMLQLSVLIIKLKHFSHLF